MIPLTAHFIWFGPRFEWLHALALRSAARHGGFERVILHHSDDISHNACFAELVEEPRVELRALDPHAVFARCGERAAALSNLFDELSEPAGRANMVRAALLHSEGGVYLDTDTVTLQSFAPLCATYGAFCGLEHVVFPRALKRSKAPLPWVKAYAKTALRDVCRRLPAGYQHFRKIEDHYTQAANNAVLGVEAGHRLSAMLLDGMVAMPPERRLVRYALGTHLLQDTMDTIDEGDTRALPPKYFYPLGPEISEHWFKAQPELDLDTMLSPDTVVVHWYASVRTKHIVPEVDAAWVRANAARIPLAKLALPYAEEP